MNRDIELIGDIDHVEADIDHVEGDIEGANHNAANVIIREPKPQSCWGRK